MKKYLMFLLFLVFVVACEKESIELAEVEDSTIENRSDESLRIWPPDGSYYSLTMDTDEYVISATSDEAEDDPSHYDGSTLNDIVISPDCKTIQIRKERMANGNGRVYKVVSTDKTYTISVPRWPWGWYSVAVDDGAAYSVYCQ